MSAAKNNSFGEVGLHPMGGPLLALVRTPHSVRLLAVALGITFVLVALGLGFLPWQQSVSGSGRVVAFSPVERHQRLEAPIDGRVVRVLAREGQQLAADDIVVEIADVDPRFLERLGSERQLVMARQEAAQARREQVRDRVVALEQARTLGIAAADARLDMARERLRQAEQAVIATGAARAVAQTQQERITSLAAQGLRSQREAELATLDARRAETDDVRAKAAETSARAEIEAQLSERSRLECDTSAGINDARAGEQIAAAEVAAAGGELVRLDTRISRQNTQAVTVPRAAIAFRVIAQEGQMVKQGEPLIEIVPLASSSAVEIWVDGNDAPLVQSGRPVRLQFEGWPALQFVGWPRAARGTFGGVVALVDAHDDTTGRFRVLVQPTAEEPWPSPDLLRQGVRATGWILLEQVPLGFELWRRFNACPPTVPQPASKYDMKSDAKKESK